MTARYFGQPVPRIEDPDLLSGTACFADDIHLPGMLHACFVRSSHAHALIRGIDKQGARNSDGVHAVLTLDDLCPLLTTMRVPVAIPSPALRAELNPWVLSDTEVCHVGEPIALVIADDRYKAEDAAERIVIDYERLPAVVDPRAALAPGAAPVRADFDGNMIGQFISEYGDCDTAFSGAAHVFHETFRLHKGGGHAIECRAVVARHDPADGVLTVWDATQMPHRAHAILVRLLGCAEDDIRVIAPDVGGGFGPKFVFYPEEAAVAVAARLLGRPIKWIEDKRENFTATTHERDQYWDVEIAVQPDGRLIGVRGQLIHDHGAYTPYGTALPVNAALGLIGPYIVPHYRLEAKLALTNLIPATPTRGAGRPQATFIMERLLDRAASGLGLDRTEIRRRNLIPPDRMPYATALRTRDGAAMTYDSGDYPAAQALAVAKSGYDDFPARQAKAREAGRFIGIGLANYVEGTGRGPFERATVRIGPSGRVTVHSGAAAQGQGSKTMLAQLCADQLGVAPHDVTVVAGDTGKVIHGLGAFASRQAVTAGNSVHLAARAVREKALRAGAEMLEAAVEDIELRDGRIQVRGVPEMGIALGEAARQLGGMPGYAIPGGLAPGLESSVDFVPEMSTYSNGCHVVEAAVDPETGSVEILRYLVVHDCGRIINPMMVEGQIIGGVAHGLGAALFEWMRYDENGQPLTVNYGDYLLPAAPEMPRIEIHHMESPSPLNPLGVKGVGESGTIPAIAAVGSAIEDALRPFGVQITETPITPMRLVELIQKSGSAALR